MPIKRRLIILFLSVAIIPDIFIGLLNFSNAKDELLLEKREKLQIIADLKVDKIEVFFDEIKNNMQVAQDYFNIKTNLPIVTKYSQDRLNPEYVQAKAMLDGQLRAWGRGNKGMVNFVLVSPDGKVVYVANNTHMEHLDEPLWDPESKAFEEGKKGIYLSDVFKNPYPDLGYDFAMLVTAPAYDFEKRFIGVIAFELNMGPVYSFIQNTAGLGQTGETLIVQKKISRQGTPDYKGRDGEYVLFLNSLRHDPQAAFKKIVFMGEKGSVPAQQVAKGGNGSGFSVDYQNKEILAVWRYIPSLTWGLVVKMDMQEILAPVNALKYLTIIICVIVGIIAGIIALIISNSIANPISNLNKGAEMVGSGNLDYKVGIDTKDEIGQLSKTFDQMTSKLKVQMEGTQAANQQLQASERQLKAANQQLRANEQQLRAEITERKKADETLRESEEKFRIIFDNAADGILLASIETKKFEFGNKMILEMLGYNSEEIKNLSLSNIHPPEDLPRIIEGFERQAKGKIKLIADALIKRKNGTVFYADITAHPIVLSGRKYLMGIFRDVTEHKKARDELLHAAEEWSTTFDSISDMVSIIDKNYKIIKVNMSFADRLKMKPQDVIGKTCYELIHGTNEPPAFCPHTQTLETKEPKYAEYFESKLGISLDVSTSPIFDEKGELIGSVYISRDNTFRKNLEKNQRLSELGKLVAEMAHEVNNPLMVVSGRAQLSLLDETINAEVKENLTIIHGECNKAKEIIQRLLKFSRPSKGMRKETDINQSIGSLVELIEHQFQLTNVEVKKSFAENLPLLIIDEKQIQEVIINLLNNAREAMPEGGTIDITTLQESDFVKINIRDSGQGMDDETLSKVFEPFYTTKEKGTGLGLPVCYGIIKAHGGELKLESQSEKGTTATILLPIKGGETNA